MSKQFDVRQNICLHLPTKILFVLAEEVRNTCVTPVKMLLSEEVRQLSLHNQVKREKFSIFFSTVKRKNVEKGLLNKNNG